MGVSLCQYRQAIGLFNRVKVVKSYYCVNFLLLPTLLLSALLICLLLVIGGVETNPGPNQFVKLKHLKVCHINIRGGLLDKIIDLKTSLCQGYDVITVSETFLTGKVLNSDLKLPGYQEIIRRDRPTHGGGLAVYIRNGLSYKRVAEYESNSFEQIWLRLNTTQGKLLVCVAYRPPDYDEFWDLFDYNLEQTKLSNPGIKYFLTLGDLNGDFETVNGTKLKDLCVSHNFKYLIDEPTRITPTRLSVLDQILVNMPNFVRNAHVLPPVGYSDHCAVGVELNFKIPVEKAYTRHIWLYKDADFIGFRRSLELLDWSECFDTDDVNIACDKWSEKFLNVAKSYIPNKDVLIRPKDSPWYTNTLRKFKRKVHRLFNIVKKNPSQHNWDRYINVRNEYRSALNEAHHKYESDIAKSLTESRNTKQWWSVVKSMLGKGADDSYPPLNDNGSYVNDSSEKAGLFNSFFLSHSKLDTSNAQLPIFTTKTDKKLTNITVTEQEVYDQIKSLETKKATGHDGISSRMIKEAGISIVKPLTKLLNMSLENGKFPDDWKKAHVIPIHKKGDKDNVNNYRPISILPIVSKIFERIVFKHVYNYLHENNLISRHQSGFQPNESTINQLAYMYHEFSNALDKKKDVRIVFCDVSKAFDKVWHSGIIFKLKQLGINDVLLDWFTDYLHERKQRVIIKGQKSDWGIIEAGVPQGSVLGPLLFIVYINDLAEVVNCNIKMFADDTCLYVTIDNKEQIQTATNSLNLNLNNVSNWANQWLVTFNASKTKTMLLTNKNVNHPDLIFDGTVLENVTTHKHLGLNFSANLKWSLHIDKMLESASRMLDVSMKLQYKLDRKSLETIYLSFIRPKLEYGSIIWDDCTERDKERLENIQLRAARLVTGAKKGTSHELLYNELNWDKLGDRRQNVKILFMHKIVNKNMPDYLCELLPTKVGENVNIQTRLSHNIKQFPCKGAQYPKSLLPHCIDMWNELDIDVRNIIDYESFKTAVIENKTKEELYNFGDRKLNIIHAQLRLKCSNLNSHLVALHVLDDPKCICGNENETAYHFFFSCPLYTTERKKLFDRISPLCDISLDVILYGNRDIPLEDNSLIFSYVHEFIKMSKRF